MHGERKPLFFSTAWVDLSMNCKQKKLQIPRMHVIVKNLVLTSFRQKCIILWLILFAKNCAMKTFKFLPGLSLLLILVSCSSDDNGDSNLINSDVIGVWDLVAVNISAAQDMNNDGASSSNLLDEVDCITGTLLIDGDLVWTLEQSVINITTITGGQFFADCSGTSSSTGTWTASETLVSFGGDQAPSPFNIINGQLVHQIGEDLPGIQSYVYALRP